MVKRGGMPGILLVLVLCGSGLARAEGIRDLPANQWGRSATIAEQPIKRYRNGAITTPVFINRKGPYEFLVDTGAFISGVNRSTIVANSLSYKHTKTIDVIGADGKGTMRVLKFRSLIASVFIIQNPLLLELPSGYLGFRSPQRGILGTDFLASHTVVFDLDRDMIVLYPQSIDLTQGLPGYFDIIPMRFSRRDNGLFTKVKLNGKTYNALIDTGATFTAVNEKLAKRLGIDTMTGSRGNATGVNERNIDIYRTRLDSLEAGTRTWKNPKIALMKFTRGGRHYDAILGMDLLAKEPFAIDYGNKRVLLVKPAK